MRFRRSGFAVAAARAAPHAQRTLVGGGRKDLVEFTVSLQSRIDDLHRAVDEVAAGLARVDRRVDDTVANTAIVRYDAYEDTGGHQSASLALLDAARSGVVITAIQGRDYARIYMKEIDRGQPAGPALPRGAAGRRARDGPLTRPEGRVGTVEGVRYFSGAVQQVLVLNASFEPLNVCSLRRAHVLVYKGKAEVVEELDRPLCSAAARFPWPHVIRLLSYVRVPRIVQRKISRRALFARDGWRCVYCGTAGGRLTLDHVIPRSRGGGSVWENVVTSCAPCNLRKGNRLLHEVHMELAHPPRPPAPVLFIRLAAPKIPQRWEQYLAAYGATAA